LALVFLATLATGLPPALYASSPALGQILGGEIVVGGTRKNVRRNVLVVIQIAICTLVLVGMGLCQSSLYNLRHTDVGFSARNLVAATLYLEAEGFSEARGKPFYETVRQTVSALPGVEALTLAWDLPLLGSSELPVQLPDSVNTLRISHTVVDSDYFATLKIRTLAGRTFNSNDRESSSPVVVINHKMAEMFWPGRDPLGKTIVAGDRGRKLTVIGVVADGKYDELDEPPSPFFYFALSQNYRGGISVIARTKGDPRAWIEPLAKALRGLGLKILVEPVTYQNWIDLTLFFERLAADCVAGLSALGLLLALVGLFASISYAVRERKRELGIRVALGAGEARLLKMVLLQTTLVSGAGVAIGALLGVVATILFRSQLFGISPFEWIVLVPVSATMLALSLLVAYFSARPWIRVDPMEALRHA
jgi:predicted permease